MYRNYCWLLLLLGVAAEGAQPKDEWLQTLQDISANPSREMALTEQESSWNPFAKSPYATGLRQFTDSTGEWLSRTHCRHLGPYRPLNADWSLKCGVIYAEWLELQVPTTDCYCDTRQNAERAYNGGLGWINREAKLAKSNSSKDLIDQCLNTGRAEWACEENTSYPKRISIRQTKYLFYGGRRCR